MKNKKSEFGFTLVEIVVATAIFAFVASAMMSLFNYTLRINRKSEALRQVSQGGRNFIEFLAKEIRNGQVNYGMIGGAVPRGYSVGPCGNGVLGSSYFSSRSNKLSLTNSDGEDICIYYGDANGNALPSNVFSTTTFATLVLQKAGGVKQVLNPPNFKIENLMFMVRPLCDPYTLKPPGCSAYGNDYPRIHPIVTIIIKFVSVLPTGETVPVYYQTSVSSGKYDIPH